jgi:hypothetical protein
MWFYDYAPYWSVDRTLKYRLMFAWAAFVGLAGIFICGAGVSLVGLRGFAIFADRSFIVLRIRSRYQDQLRKQWRCRAMGM